MTHPVRALLTPRPVREGTPPGTLDLPKEGGPPQLWLARADACRVDSAAEALLAPDEALRRSRFAHESDRHRYTVAHVVLRRLVGAYLRQDPAEVTLTRLPCARCGRPGGRPALHRPDLHFSLSHSDDLALYAFARTPVGVDVEASPPDGTADELMSTLHPRERAGLAALPPAERSDAFLRCWTRKEACLKGEGAGVAHGIEFPFVGTAELPEPVPGWQVTDVLVTAGYRAAVAVAETTLHPADHFRP
ncbi:4'-phosphopantetheinyl transferase superfamily protein [Streptomyces sp. NPDC046182]|uniref:4'-phosphopantetheinyl transferase family protein n=1 Tax=Streptomyces sp. NPDC046182 TaxID=3154601 RepID=UPI0033D9DE59